MNPLTVGVGILYLLHWFEMIPWIKVSMALLPMRLVWAKALHLGEEAAGSVGTASQNTDGECETELATDVGYGRVAPVLVQS